MSRVCILGLLLLAACSPDGLTDPLTSPGSFEAANGFQEPYSDRPIRVMTRNVFVGADVDAVLAAGSPEQLPGLVAGAFQELIATDFTDRAQALAREIRLAKPHVIGLQEISTIRRQSPGDLIVGGTSPAETVVWDYLALLLDALDAAGERYHVAAMVQNADVEVPMLASFTPLAFDDVRLTDFDVILVRDGVDFGEVEAGNFQARLQVPIGPSVIDIPRGYTAITARIGGTEFRFVNTHPEPVPIPDLIPLQMAQVGELLTRLASETRPVILLGDLNTPAPTGDSYQLIAAAGFLDAWAFGPHADEPGYTCCHDLSLTGESVFDERIDLVLMRPSADTPEVRAQFVDIVGDTDRERTPNGLWPSDHAGVVAHVRFGRPASSGANGTWF